MGGVCPGVAKNRDLEFQGRNSGISVNLRKNKKFNKKNEKSESCYLSSNEDLPGKNSNQQNSGELHVPYSSELKPSPPARTVTSNKVPQVSSFLGRAGVVGLERAVDVLDTLGSSMLNLNASSGFSSGFAPRGNKISILAFEVANTIVKGSNLLQSISEENIQFLKKDVLHSEGVQQLVSADMNELLCIAAADKREESNVFSREVIRFGDLCKDPQWHNLGRFFSKLDSNHAINKQIKEEVEFTVQELITLAQHTFELYHEFQALDRFEQDYQRRLEEMESVHLPPKGESFMILQSELKHQRKLVRSLEKKSLWSKNLEEVVAKLVDVVTFIHQEILQAFGSNGLTLVGKEPSNNCETLGKAGLALHYANVIIQIDNIASRPTCLPSNMRDTLYNALPVSVKTALRSQLQTADPNEELTITQVKAKMEKTLQWLVPVATNTTKAHQGFGWVGEWANNCAEFGKNAANNKLIRLQTLYHANILKTESYILDQVVWLHHLIGQVRHKDIGLRPQLPVRSQTFLGLTSTINALVRQPQSSNHDNKTQKVHVQLSQEDRDMLEEVSWRKIVIRRSKSQEFGLAKKGIKAIALSSRSVGSSPVRETDTTPVEWPVDVLDVMDGLDPSF